MPKDSLPWAPVPYDIRSAPFWYTAERRPATRSEAFLDLVLDARRRPSPERFKGVELELDPWELPISERDLAARWGWSRDKVRTMLSRLKADHRIETKSDHPIHVIRIILAGNRAFNPTTISTQNPTTNQTTNQTTDFSKLAIRAREREAFAPRDGRSENQTPPPPSPGEGAGSPSAPRTRRTLTLDAQVAMDHFRNRFPAKARGAWTKLIEAWTDAIEAEGGHEALRAKTDAALDWMLQHPDWKAAWDQRTFLAHYWLTSGAYDLRPGTPPPSRPTTERIGPTSYCGCGHFYREHAGCAGNSPRMDGKTWCLIGEGSNACRCVNFHPKTGAS